MYRGYKRRNVRLDELRENPPQSLKDKKFTSATFEEIESKEELSEVRLHIWELHNNLQRVIKARKVHHEQFFSLDMDF